MTNRVTRTPQAQADLIALAEYDRAEAGLATALRFVESAEAALCALCEHPRMGAVLDLAAAPEAGIRHRHISGFTRLLILDRPTADGVQLIRVLDAARDLDDLFRPGSHGSASESALFFRAVGNVSARAPQACAEARERYPQPARTGPLRPARSLRRAAEWPRAPGAGRVR